MRPVPYLASVPILLLSVICAHFVFHSSRARLWSTRGLLLLAGVTVGIVSGIFFSARTYDYDAEWRIIGYPMMVAALKRVVADDKIQWHDYIGAPPPFVIAANFAFWLLLPSIPLAVIVWLRDGIKHHVNDARKP